MRSKGELNLHKFTLLSNSIFNKSPILKGFTGAMYKI